MGCSASSADDDGRSDASVFDVANVDDSGLERSSGKLEVTSTDLVLYYPGARDAIRWPFQSLRRYGFNDHLFSFESGRRCPSGHGIYAFRCSRAEQLFRQLQESIARAGEERSRPLVDERSGELGSRSLVAETRRTENQTQNSAEQTNSHFERIDPRLTDYINEAKLTESLRRYINHQTTTSDPRGEEVTTPRPQPLDINSQPLTTASSSSFLNRPSCQSTRDNTSSVQYAQLDLPMMELVEDYDEEAEVFQTPPEVGSVVAAGHFRPNYVNMPGPIASDALSSSPTTLTYAQLDLSSVDPSTEGRNDSTCAEVPRCEPFPSRDKPETYAHIDFRRTIALSTRATSVTEDEGFRKTRHNSNIEIITRN